MQDFFAMYVSYLALSLNTTSKLINSQFESLSRALMED